MAIPILEGTNIYAASAGATTHTVPLPVGAAAGELLLIGVAHSISATPTVSGWTAFTDAFVDNSFAVVQFKVYYKTATGSDTDPVVDFGATSVFLAGISTRISGALVSDPFDVSATSDNGDAGALTSITIPAASATAADTLLVRFAANNNTTNHTWTDGGAEANEVSTTGTTRRLSLATEGHPSLGDTGTATASGGSSTWCGALMAIQPTGGGEVEPGDPSQLVAMQAVWTAA